jgi:hypothetical protein
MASGGSDYTCNEKGSSLKVCSLCLLLMEWGRLYDWVSKVHEIQPSRTKNICMPSIKLIPESKVHSVRYWIQNFCFLNQKVEQWNLLSGMSLCSFCYSIKSHIPPQVHTGSLILFEAFLLVPSTCHSRDDATLSLRLPGRSQKPTIISKANLSKFVSDAWKFATSCQ